ncbi:L-seryl-tRNA(Sec) selenium transferase [Leptolinea sp. HRD-7]|nr:L-seryl-tRNA(Sec) selenium transferase [Leptolinea sp. HRD-7]
MSTDLSGIPGVDKILNHAATGPLITRFGRQLVVDETRNVLQQIRTGIFNGGRIPEVESIINTIAKNLSDLERISTVSVINATGVILHTNLGRAPLSANAISAIEKISSGYSSLEFDLPSGTRGKRTTQIEKLFQKLMPVEEALVVNNNAAAVLLILSSLASRKKVIIPRGELVEIGGGFRVPDIMKLSGAKLLEIGTTNQVHLEDYERAIKAGGEMILVVHPSNFRIIGYTGKPSLEEIVDLGHHYGIPVVEDLGSGAILDTSLFGLAHEPTVQESIRTGVDVVSFSGDKLLGGPQAGCVLGKSMFLQKIKKHPLARAVRADKTLIASLEATLIAYLKHHAVEEIPVWKMVNADLNGLKTRIEKWIEQLGCGEIVAGKSTLGGGSMPEEEMPTWLLTLSLNKPDHFLNILRAQDTAVAAFIKDGLVCFDPRTVFPEQDPILVSCISKSLSIYKKDKNHEISD